jgi:hypothetical protein
VQVGDDCIGIQNFCGKIATQFLNSMWEIARVSKNVRKAQFDESFGEAVIDLMIEVEV